MSKVQDMIIGRGRKESTPLGTTIFCGLRPLVPLLQRSLLLSAPLSALAPYLGRSVAVPPPTGGKPVITGSLSLTPFQIVILGMSVGAIVTPIFNTLQQGSQHPPLHVSSCFTKLMRCTIAHRFLD